MALNGLGSAARPRTLLSSAKTIREVYRYLWKGQAAGDPHDARVAYVRERFAALLDLPLAGVPQGALDPFIDHVASKLAGLVGRLPEATEGPDQPSPAR